MATITKLFLLGCLGQLRTAEASEVTEGLMGDFEEVAGSSKNGRLIVVHLGTGPTTKLTEESFFGGDPKKFSEDHNAQIVIAKRKPPGNVYGWDDVDRIAGQVEKAKSGRNVWVLGYSNGGGIAACVASKIKAYALGMWSAPGDFVTRGCTSGVNVAAEYIAEKDQFRSMSLPVWEKAKQKIKHTKSFTSSPGSHVTPMTLSIQHEFWTFLFHPPTQTDVVV